MARWFYTLFFYLLTPLVILRLCYRSLKAPAYRQRMAERFGLFSGPSVGASIWVHSVSVGETIAAAPLIKQLQQRYPDTPLVVTTMTPTGSVRVKALFGDSVLHVYAPYDLPGAILRFIRHFNPQLLVIMETELWPNTIHYSHKRAVPVIVANARLSAKSAAGYRRFAALTQSMLAQLTKVVAQSQADAERFLSLGLGSEQVTVSGSIKFDISLADELKAKAQALKAQWSNNGQRLVWLAASTHEGEDEIILEAFKQLLANSAADKAEPLLVLVPRHPERFQRVGRLSQQMGFNTAQRSQVANPPVDCQVFIGDTMGELLLFFGCADIAFVGGSLVDNGGHNMLEAAVWGLPIITGQSDYNFLEISGLLQQQGALRKVADSTELAQCLEQLRVSPEARAQMGEPALQVMADNRGALDRLLAEINQQLV